LTQLIKIKVIGDGDPVYSYLFEITNGMVCIKFDIHGYDTCFNEFSNQLEFPLVLFENEDEFVAKYQYGKNEKSFDRDDWSYYFQMIVYSCNTNGKAAIQIIFDNNLTEPDKNRVSFSIITDPYAIIQLGNMLKSWNPLKDKEFSWIAPN
jgi:hypothetical protein